MDSVDFGKTAADYAQHRQGFPDETFARLAAHDVGISGQRVLDVGRDRNVGARLCATRLHGDRA